MPDNADVEAAWDAVHDALPAGWTGVATVPPMWIVRWRWVLVPMVLMVAGCLPHATALPESFVSTYDGTRRFGTFTVQSPPAGATGQDIVDDLRAMDVNLMFHLRGVPVFGVIDCLGSPECSPGPAEGDPGGARTVWVVLYPDCTDPDGKDVGWAVVDAVNGLESGYGMNDPCN